MNRRDALTSVQTARAGCAVPAAHPPRRSDVGLSSSHIRPHSRGDLWQVNAYRGGSLIQVCAPSMRGESNGGGKRGIITRFSEASRRRLIRALAKTKRDRLPVFVTLTYPDNFPGDPVVWKGHLKAWLKRLKREHPKASGFWKLELKPRQSGENQGQVAPHFHLLLWGLPLSWQDPEGMRKYWTYQFQKLELATPSLRFWKKEVWEDGQWLFKTETLLDDEVKLLPVVEFVSEHKNNKDRVVRVVEHWVRDDGKCFYEMLAVASRCNTVAELPLEVWVSLTWTEVVGSGDPRHLRAGTRVEEIRSREGVMFYASKYVCKLDTESTEGCGRFWGIHNREEIPWAKVERVPLNGKQALQLMRIARRYIWTQQRQREHPKKIRWRAGCGMSFFCDATAWLERLPAIASGCPLGASCQGIRGTSSRRQRRPTSAPERAESVCNGRDSPRPTMSSHLQTGHTPTSDQPPANPLRAGAAIANVPHTLKHPTAARCAPPSWPEVLSVPSPASGGRKERAQPYGARLDRSGAWDNAGAVRVPENDTLCPWLQQNMGLDVFNATEYSISSE